MKRINSRQCIGWVAAALLPCAPVSGANPVKTMSLADDIQMTRFLEPRVQEARAPVTKFSPDGRFFALVTERGWIERNVQEATVWVGKTAEVETHLSSRASKTAPALTALLRLSHKDGPVITDVRWAGDSSALYFLAMASTGRWQLFKAALNGVAGALTPDTQNVVGYTIQDEQIVYFATSALIGATLAQRRAAPAYFASNQSMLDLLDPELATRIALLSDVWVMREGKRWRVEDPTTRQPFLVQGAYVDTGLTRDPAVSPDGRFLAVPSPLPEVPKSWEQYRGGMGAAAAIRSGPQDPRSYWWENAFVESYFLVDLTTGRAEPLLNAPTGISAGWFHFKSWTPAWSADGRAVVLPSTFLPLGTLGADGRPVGLERPCIAVYDLQQRQGHCAVELKSFMEEGRLSIDQVGLSGPRNEVLTITPFTYGRGDGTAVVYRRIADGSWKLDASPPPAPPRRAFELYVEQGLNQPPTLVAVRRGAQAAKVLWDPNPEIASLALGAASVFHWKDPQGRPWYGGLVLPPHAVRGQRYPLIVQTHGFSEHEFLTSGAFTTNFAARQLAGYGFAVLQVNDLRYDFGTSQDLPASVAGYESAVAALVREGSVDGTRVGLAGFSRTMLDVMQALAFGQYPFAVASVADGETGGLMQYAQQDVSATAGGVRRQYEEYFGGKPYGEGLKNWLKRSSALNLDRIKAPVLIIHKDVLGTVGQWELYSGLAYLQKPVESLIVGQGTHPLTNPAQRLATQGATIDWFRFWLQEYEDPAAAKADQYARWRKLRDRS